MENLERAMPWLFIAGVLVVWELAALAFQVPTFLLPRPSVIAVTLYDKFEPIASNSWDTLVRTLAGFALAVVLGALLGIAIGSSRLVYRGLYPVLIGFNSIPKVAVVPVFVIWFGSGAVPAILTAFLGVVLPDLGECRDRARHRRAGTARRFALARRPQATDPH